MKLKPKYKLSLIILASISVALTFIFSLRGKGVLQSENLTHEDTAKIIKPAVIRILQHSTGQVTIPKFEIDTKKVTLNILPTAPSDVQEVDSYIGGSGFVVNPDGYIITNAHVASENSIKDLYIESALTKAFTEKFGELTNESLEKNFENPDDYLNLYTEGLKLLKNNSVFNLKNEIVVLNPSDSQEYLTSLIKNSFPATRIWVNENYQLDDKDIALLKIDLKNLPSLLLANDLSLNVGSEILVFGFPSTAEVTYRSPLESTLTNGLVSAIKFSEKKNFKVFQTNAKISTGSSGGPLLNKDGKVVGVITFQTGGSLRQEGDSFAFAVPVELVKTVLQKNNIQNIEGEYNKKLKEALVYFHSNQCEVALKKFAEAENFNHEFTGPKYLDTYRDQCTNLTKQNLSLDSTFELTLQKIKNIETFVWFVVLGRMMLILLAVFILAGLLKRMQKDEQHILALEIKIEENNQRRTEMLTMLENRGNPLPLPEPEMHAESRVALGLPQPHLKDFILEAKKIGIPDDEIKLELSKAGWDEKEILHTFGTLV